MALFGPPNVDKLKAKSDVKGLIKAVGYTKDAQVRQHAAEALGDIGDERAIEPLIRLAEKYGAARSALAKFNSPRATGALANLPLLCATCNRLMKKVEAVSTAPRVQIGTEEDLKSTPLECPTCQLVFCSGCAKRGQVLSCPMCEDWLLDMATRTTVAYHHL